RPHRAPARRRGDDRARGRQLAALPARPGPRGDRGSVARRGRRRRAAGEPDPRGPAQRRGCRDRTAGARRGLLGHLTTDVVDAEPTLPALSATRTASVWAPRARPVGRSMRSVSTESSNRPSAVVPSCHGPSSTENAISAIVLIASEAFALAL